MNYADCTNAASVHFSIIINPAIWPNDNPQRLLKNVRVAAIEDAAMKFYYDQLASVESNNKVTSIFASSPNNKDDDKKTMRLKEVSIIDPTQYNTQTTYKYSGQYKR